MRIDPNSCGKKEIKHIKKEVSLDNIFDVFGDNSCIAYYPLNGNANDLGGKYNGKWEGNEQYIDTKNGKAAKFDGNSYINLNNIFFGEISDFTCSLYLNRNGSNSFSLVEQYSAGTSERTQYYSYNNGDNLHLWSATGGYLFFDDVTLDDSNSFYFIVLVRKDGVFNLIINDKKSSPKGNKDFKIEQSNTTIQYSEKSNIIVNKVRFFNKALTDDEIKILFENKMEVIQ